MPFYDAKLYNDLARVIKNRVATAVTSVLTALTDYAVDHLASAADGTDVYPASVVDDSIIAMMLSKSDPASASSYSNQTDSMEAISDKITAVNTDIGDPSARANLQSLEAMLGNPDTASKSIWNEVRHIRTTAIDGSAVPVANTLSDILHKDGSYTFDNTTDSLEAIRDRVDTLNTNDIKYIHSTAINSPTADSVAYLVEENNNHLHPDCNKTHGPNDAKPTLTSGAAGSYGNWVRIVHGAGGDTLPTDGTKIGVHHAMFRNVTALTETDIQLGYGVYTGAETAPTTFPISCWTIYASATDRDEPLESLSNTEVTTVTNGFLWARMVSDGAADTADVRFWWHTH